MFDKILALKLGTDLLSDNETLCPFGCNKLMTIGVVFVN